MIQAVLGFTLTSFVLGGFALQRANHNVDAFTQRQRWIKFLVYFLIIHIVIGSAIAGSWYFIALISVILIIGAHELLKVLLLNRTTRLTRKLVIVGIYFVLAGLSLRFAKDSAPTEVVWVYLITASFDGFSQLTGQWLGRTRLAPRLSPNKTVEGAIGGLVAAMLTAVVLRSLGGLSAWQAPFVGLMLGIAGLSGDLAASYVKRLTGVKDYGRILPEHGGVLDRFDSLLMTAPIFYLWSY